MWPPRLWPTCCLLLLLAPAPGAAGDPRGPAAKPRTPGPAAPRLKQSLDAPDYLSPLARQMLRRRMERHGRDTATLFLAVVTLQRVVVAELAKDLAAEPRIVRPLPDSMDDLNAALPERFFVLQDELRDRARDLEKAALVGTDDELSARMASLTQTCVACHSAYLTGDKSP